MSIDNNLPEEIAELLKQIKYGDLFKPSEFSSVDEARRFIDEFTKNFPEHTAEDLAKKKEEIAKAEADVGIKRDAHQEKLGLAATISHLDNWVNRYIPQSLDGVDGYIYKPDKAGKKQFLEGKASEICYGFLKECLKTGVEDTKRRSGERAVEEVKTPYEKLPKATKMKYQFDKIMGRTPDFEVDLLSKCEFACRHIRDNFADNSMTGDLFRDATSKKYIAEIIKMPNEKMAQTLSVDVQTAWAMQARAGRELTSAREVESLKRCERRDMLLDNQIVSVVREVMDGKVQKFERIQAFSGKARVDLAKRGLISNEEVAGMTVHGSVAADRIADAKAKGVNLPLKEALKRGRGGKG